MILIRKQSYIHNIPDSPRPRELRLRESSTVGGAATPSRKIYKWYKYFNIRQGGCKSAIKHKIVAWAMCNAQNAVNRFHKKNLPFSQKRACTRAKYIKGRLKEGERGSAIGVLRHSAFSAGPGARTAAVPGGLFHPESPLPGGRVRAAPRGLARACAEAEK